ncbi:uncharacterized protein VP01_1607g3 [Puccinia sorghi]|uniref:GAG-pre-integrase domain-containing protein n=1 Tax=Puccinia sorghi TaxID=27349 RepID=A0A0L6VHC9_9BASI|nr:uncharacterized protein VP01_1607g3 [Puccinia sorghi]
MRKKGKRDFLEGQENVELKVRKVCFISLVKGQNSDNCIDSREFTWDPSTMTPDKRTLLFWHCFFGHASLRQVWRLVKLQLGYGLPSVMPSGSIKCPACSICKENRTSSLGPSHWSTEKLSVIVCGLIGPFNPSTMSGFLKLNHILLTF